MPWLSLPACRPPQRRMPHPIPRRAPLSSPRRKPGRERPRRSRATAYPPPGADARFFGVKPADTVVEIWPGGGWYTEILAPYLAASGTLYAAGRQKGLAMCGPSGQAMPDAYRAVRYAMFPAVPAGRPCPQASADVVLTFRNVHNWRFGGRRSDAGRVRQMFAMLKPGGTLGLVEHHLPEAREDRAKSRAAI